MGAKSLRVKWGRKVVGAKSLDTSQSISTSDLSDISSEDSSDVERSDFSSDETDDDNIIPIDIEKRSIDVLEEGVILKFKTESCGCSELHKSPCSNIVDNDELISYRQRCTEMSSSEKDICVKSQLFMHRHKGVTTQGNGKRAKVRERATQEYYFMGVQVCRALFCFAHNISKNTLGSIAKSLDEIGILPRTHKNKNKMPVHGLSFVQREQIKTFISEYATENALPLPGRLPNLPKKTVLLLPSDKKVADIHSIYNESATQTGYRPVCLKTFRNLWNQLCPHIQISKPSTDLCHVCQKYSVSLNESGKLNEDQKQDLLDKYGSHVNRAQGQRTHYKDQTSESKLLFANTNTVEGSPPCTIDATYHYSWDYAQQVHYPHHSQQVGPIYFRTPRKCHVFGICAEGSGKQTFYLIDESQCTGKGAESVVSMAHHYLHTYGIGEKHAQIHFDNASGQNKNNVVLWYAMWRTLTGLHETVTLSMMIAGHTKFAPDWHFGIWKVKWRDSDAETLEDVASSVTRSSRGGHNQPQLVDDVVNPVTFYAWKSLLSQYFVTLKQISKYHHFSVSAKEPGVVACKEFCDSEEVKVCLLKEMPQKDVMPEVKQLPGLNAARQWYLYEQIGQFFKSELAKDATCPKPIVPKVEVILDDETDVKKGGKRKSLLLS